MVFRGIIEPRKQPSTLDSLLSSVHEMGPGIAKTISDMQATGEENEAVKRLTGKDVSGLGSDLKKEFVKSFTGAQSNKKEEKKLNIMGAIQGIERMRELLGSAGGITTSPFNWLKGHLPTETARERGELSQLGKRLIPLVAAGVPIRNQREFDTYSKIISDPSSNPQEIAGALDAIESMLNESLDEEPSPSLKPSVQEETKILFDASNPKHKAVRDKLMKMHKGNREKVQKELLKKFKEE